MINEITKLKSAWDTAKKHQEECANDYKRLAMLKKDDEQDTPEDIDEQLKNANSQYQKAWPKVVKIEKKLKKLQKQFWIDQGLSILPEWAK